MILFYSHILSERLKYIVTVLLTEQLGLTVHFTNHLDDLKNEHQPAILYGKVNGEFKNALQVRAQGLLEEDHIQNQDIKVNNYCSLTEINKRIPAFFQSDDGDFAFDLFASSFYLLSRYEEYLPHTKDSYGRFPHEDSLAFQHGFLHRPLIHEWLSDFVFLLKNKFPNLNIQRPAFRMQISYDIDQAWSYRGKGFIRSIGGLLKNPSLQRIKVLLGMANDPFDVFEKWMKYHVENKTPGIFFFPTNLKHGKYDKNTFFKYKPYQSLIQKLNESQQIGLHPSWRSGDFSNELQAEKTRLENLIHQPVKQSRQHYIRLHIPETYRLLNQVGIEKEYSMGYGSINGFRASFADQFPWFDLPNNQTTQLRIYPFSFMDANSKYEQKQTAEITLEEIKMYFKTTQEVGGIFVPIFHNFMTNQSAENKSWYAVYAWLTTQIPSSV
jgi:hypothetical protein